MKELSPEQKAIIEAPLAPICVIACAGSGKTRTAVHRLADMRRRLGDHRGRILLLSFSNVAVDTFRDEYDVIAGRLPSGAGRGGVEIDTLDGFISRNILRPHAHRTMNAPRASFLVTGREPFLNRFKFKTTEKFPADITEMQVGIRDNAPYFYYSYYDQIIELNSGYATKVVNELGRTGAYTHSLGRYWACRVLVEQPLILRALARRYPHILVDESQDIGTLHETILELLSDAGSQISLIGDPSQGIYEFAGANGEFLRKYGQRPGVATYPLTWNYRSVSPILTIANRLSQRQDTSKRDAPETTHGAFFLSYKKAELEQLITAFQAAVVASGLKLDKSAVVCRNGDLANTLGGIDKPVGEGLVKGFVVAALHRDKRQDHLNAFKTAAGCLIGLLADPPGDLLTKITHPARYPEARALRRAIWNFVRNATDGLPSAELVADSQWHPKLLQNIKTLLEVFRNDFGLAPVENLGKKLAKRKLPDGPLMAAEDLVTEQAQIRVDTVHQVKGESLDGVLYIATKEHVDALLAGVGTELGRIGYVAVTRARDLFWLAVPANAVHQLRPTLLEKGFTEVGTNVG